jgi:dihydroorotate dehydrogenase (fumarate)
MKLETTIMGIKLMNPIIVGSSSLSDSVDNVKKLAQAGAGAVVLKSLYEEEIIANNNNLISENEMYKSYPEAMEYVHTFSGEDGITNYLELIRGCKKQVHIPVIASINCFSLNKWIDFSKEIENAGADGIELNISIFPKNEDHKAEKIENEYYRIVKSIKDIIKIPIAVKMSSYFTNIRRPGEITLSLRWVGLLSGKLTCDLVGATGIHDASGIIKQILAGAKATQICSILYENGIDYIQEIISELNAWMNRKGFNSIEDFRGLINKDPHNTLSWERIHFMKKTYGNIIKPITVY